MTGRVDEHGRALLRVTLRHPVTGAVQDCEAWIDTACTGELVLPQGQVAALQLPNRSAVKARLADGSEVELDTYTCLIDWFGTSRRAEVVVNQGASPLLGVGLLKDRQLTIDYPRRTVSLL